MAEEVAEVGFTLLGLTSEVRVEEESVEVVIDEQLHFSVGTDGCVCSATMLVWAMLGKVEV